MLISKERLKLNEEVIHFKLIKNNKINQNKVVKELINIKL